MQTQIQTNRTGSITSTADAIGNKYFTVFYDAILPMTNKQTFVFYHIKEKMKRIHIRFLYSFEFL